MITSPRFKVGGCLHANAPNYVERQADTDLYDALRSREFCYVFSSRQMGKSSLLVRVKERLQAEGACCIYLDMTRLGGTDLTQQQWIAGVGISLIQGLKLPPQVDFLQWWKAREALPLMQRLSQLVEEVILPSGGDRPIYVLIDEIDSLLGLPFSTDAFFTWMRACYNQRSHNEQYHRLTFALFGVATPTDLIADKQLTPFNIGQAIQLEGFTFAESAPLLPGLEPFVDYPSAVLQAILSWTGGQPFLTQKLCQLVVKQAQQAETLPLWLPAGAAELWIEELVRSHILSHWESQDEPIHLRTIRDHLFWHENRIARLLGLYQQLLQGKPVYTDDSREQIDLLLSGLVVRRDNQLAIKNRIYRQVFTPAWVKQQLHWLRPYAVNLDAWVESDRQDNACLLRGQTLLEVEQWARNKSLSDLDYQFLAASQDMERQHIQQQLTAKAESERFFRQLAEAVPQIVWIVEPDGRLSYTNQQGNDFSGLALDDVQDWKRLDIVHPEDRPLSLAAWKHSLETGEPYERQLRMMSREGNYRWFLNRAIPIRDGAGNIVKWFGTSTDLDTLKREEETRRLREVEKRLHLQRWLLGTISAAFVIASGLGLYAVAQNRQARLREIEAIANTAEAQFASGNRLDALVTSIQAYTQLDRIGQVPAELATQVERELHRITVQVVERHRLNANKGRVRGLAISPDGQRIAATYDQSTIVLWNPNGTTLNTIPEKAREVVFSPDGQTLVGAMDDATVRLWRAEGTPLATLKGHSDRVLSVAISPDGQWIASAGKDKLIKLWRDGKLIRTLSGHRGAIWKVVFSPDGRSLASASADNTVMLWDLDGTPRRTFRNPTPSTDGENRLLSVAFSPDGTRLVAGDSYGNILWWNPNGTLLNTTSEHRNAVGNLVFSPDGQTLASGSWDNTIKLWNLEGTVIRSLPGHPSGTLALAFSPDGDRLISGGEDDLVRVWQLSSRFTTVLRGHRASVWSVTVAPNRSTLRSTPNGTPVPAAEPVVWSSSTDGTIKRWTPQGELLQTLPAARGEVWAVDTSPDGQMTVTAHNDGTLALWNPDGTLIQTINAHAETAFDVAFNPSGSEIASVSWDGTLKRWQLDGTLMQTLKESAEPSLDKLSDRLNAVAYSPDNQWLAVGGRDQILYLWRRGANGQFSSQPQRALSGHEDTIWDMAFSPDGQQVATASEDNTIKLWSLDGTLIHTLKGHGDRVNALTFIPANSGLPAAWGTVIASASWDKTIKLWKQDGTLLHTLEGHEERALDVAFYPAAANQKALLASAGLDNVVILWQLDRVFDMEQILDAGCEWVQDYLWMRPRQGDRSSICKRN